MEKEEAGLVCHWRCLQCLPTESKCIFEGFRMIMRKNSELHLVLFFFLEKEKGFCHSQTFHFMAD